VGRSYIPDQGQNKGLMFMCLNGDLERQFEFVQQTWLDSTTFHGLEGERDPLGGNKIGCPSGFTIPTRDGPVRLAPMARFVKSRGGGYFFLPGKKLLEFLSE
jgi:deferrochelatase/peroxidase EfeB